jgi:hypothetical protein
MEGEKSRSGTGAMRSAQEPCRLCPTRLPLGAANGPARTNRSGETRMGDYFSSLLGVGEHSALVNGITATDGLRVELEVRLGWMDKEISHDAWMRSASAGVRSSAAGFAVQMPSRLTRSNLLSTAKPGQTNPVLGLGRFTMRKSSRCS